MGKAGITGRGFRVANRALNPSPVESRAAAQRENSGVAVQLISVNAARRHRMQAKCAAMRLVPSSKKGQTEGGT